MSKTKNKFSDYKIFVELLQNGELLSKTSRPFDKMGVIKLTSNPKGELCAPFYALPTDINLIKITKRGAEVDLDPNWEGFTTYEGRIEDISSHRSTQYTHIMKKGDYGSIAYNDLRVLIRIGKERPLSIRERQVKPTGEYRGKFSQLWVGDSRDFKILTLGCLASLWLFGCFIFALLQRPDDRAKDFFDLKPVYTLPFIHPRHLELLPEALQTQLDRTDLIGSSFGYYINLTSTFLGFSSTPGTTIFKSTHDKYKELYKQQKATIRSIIQAQEKAEIGLATSKLKSKIVIPTLKGEAFDQSLLRLKDKIEILHKNFDLSLVYRRQMANAFKKGSTYEFDQYRSVDAPEVAPVKRGLTRRNFRTSSLSDEELMYFEAAELGKFAFVQQKKMNQLREPLNELTRQKSRPVGIPRDTNFVSILNPDEFDQINKKLPLIKASTFDGRKTDMVKEPLVGKVSPELINRAISRHRFDLQLCFELALRRNQRLKGSMEWQWRLDTRGKISDLTLVDSTIKDRRMIRCVRKKIASWKFPRPKHGSVEIKYPFYFAPAKG